MCGQLEVLMFQIEKFKSSLQYRYFLCDHLLQNHYKLFISDFTEKSEVVLVDRATRTAQMLMLSNLKNLTYA